MALRSEAISREANRHLAGPDQEHCTALMPVVNAVTGRGHDQERFERDITMAVVAAMVNFYSICTFSYTASASAPRT